MIEGPVHIKNTEAKRFGVFFLGRNLFYLDLHSQLCAIKLAYFQIHNLTIIFVYQMIQGTFYTLYIVFNIRLRFSGSSLLEGSESIISELSASLITAF